MWTSAWTGACSAAAVLCGFDAALCPEGSCTFVPLASALLAPTQLMMASATFGQMFCGVEKLMLCWSALQVESMAGITTALVATIPSQATTAGTLGPAQVGMSPGCHARLRFVQHADHCSLCIANPQTSEQHAGLVIGAAGVSAGQQYEQGRQTGSGTGGAPIFLRGLAAPLDAAALLKQLTVVWSVGWQLRAAACGAF